VKYEAVRVLRIQNRTRLLGGMYEITTQISCGDNRDCGGP
jgi:hypothetical protein